MKLNIVRAIDVYGWAYYFVGQEYSRYSQHSIKMYPRDEVNLEEAHVLYIHGPDMSPGTRTELPAKARAQGVKVVGGYGGQVDFIYSYLDAAGYVAVQSADYCREKYPGRPALFFQEAIDTDFFSPEKPIASSKLRVGFAGRLHGVKRPHLLKSLNHEIITMSNHGPKHFVEKTLDKMRDWYHTLDVLVLTSESECMPRVVLEAMACGLPVVVTRVGCLPHMVDKRWIVDVNPEEEVVRQMNECLTVLENPKIRMAVGERNRQIAVDRLSWRRQAPIWDSIFECIYDEQFDEAQKIADENLAEFTKTWEEPELQVDIPPPADPRDDNPLSKTVKMISIVNGDPARLPDFLDNHMRRGVNEFIIAYHSTKGDPELTKRVMDILKDYPCTLRFWVEPYSTERAMELKDVLVQSLCTLEDMVVYEDLIEGSLE